MTLLNRKAIVMPHFSTTLRFVESTDDGYGIYTDAAGDEHFLQDGTGVELFEFDSLDITDEWNNFAVSYHMNKTEAFRNMLTTKVIDSDHYRVDEIWFCDGCVEPSDEDESRHVNGGDERVCDDCLDSHYFHCSDCEEYRPNDDSTYTLHDERVCEGCIDNNYSHCDHCDGYYHHESDGHEHGGCDCEAPGQKFAVRNGDAMLGNDERASISLAAGFLSDEGIGTIARLIRDHAQTLHPSNPYEEDGRTVNEEYRTYQRWINLSYSVAEIGSEWQTKDGNYTKRLSKFAYKSFEVKVPPSILTEVGNIGRAHSAGSDVSVEFTRDLNLPAEEFYHEDSCWWQSYSESRCALKNNGGLGLRTFDENSRWNPVTGRAWVMPMRKTEHGSLVPTFNTETPDAFIVFNGYGDLSGYAPARIVAAMNGMTYRKIDFHADPMYVNNDAGYLVASEEIAKDYTDGSITMYADTHSNLYYSEEKVAASCNHFEPCNHESELANV